uniref:Putative secreted protein n=1 Tax=Ixodes scapularis TaxID=6945 RepID=A0A4D5RCP4_IXOSC
MAQPWRAAVSGLGALHGPQSRATHSSVQEVLTERCPVDHSSRPHTIPLVQRCKWLWLPVAGIQATAATRQPDLALKLFNLEKHRTALSNDHAAPLRTWREMRQRTVSGAI